MVLILGAEASGKRSYARKLGYRDDQMADGVLDARPVLYNLQALAARDPANVEALLPALLQKQAVLCNEVGAGVIPAERAARDAREATGRLCILLAQRAARVVRLVAGIPTVLRAAPPEQPCGCRGLIHYYYGDGKGKTTAALGLALRASGCGCRVLIAQFFKSARCGELDALALLPHVSVLRCTHDSWVSQMGEAQRAALRAQHDRILTEALARAETLELLVLDEAADAAAQGLLDPALLDRAVRQKPPGLELAITGHRPLPWLVEAADYVTEMQKIKHPYDGGVAARRGVEY